MEAALEGEMDHHLAEKKISKNRRNGKSRKKLKTSSRLADLTVPRDRTSTFEPQIIPKRQSVLVDDL